MRMNETEEGAQPKENIETAKLVKANAIKSDDMEFGQDKTDDSDNDREKNAGNTHKGMKIKNKKLIEF